MQKLKVIFHVNEAHKWDAALANITNLLIDTGDEGADVILLSNGPAVEAYADAAKAKVMHELNNRGVRFQACRNSLNKFCIGSSICLNEKTLPDFVEVVPAGVTALIKSQAEGYAYIKP